MFANLCCVVCVSECVSMCLWEQKKQFQPVNFYMRNKKCFNDNNTLAIDLNLNEKPTIKLGVYEM